MLEPSKYISDAVHGTVPLTAVEVAVVASKSFQRLRNVRQLGLAHYVYPGADYSRFAHSIGACSLTGRILTALDASPTPSKLDDRGRQLVRLAALLHDVGHYPFSHTFEHALIQHHSMSLLQPKSGDGSTGDPQKAPLKHESVGSHVLRLDPQICGALRDHHIEPEEVSDIFRRQKPGTFSSLVSSDLDVDRIDYLMRTAHHSGLPYGNVDVGYLITQMRLDEQNRLCLSAKALRAAEHLLINRYFDYRQVAFHKTVAGFELALQELLVGMVKENMFDMSEEKVDTMITSGDWALFDDIAMSEQIRNYAVRHKEDDMGVFARSVLDRQPPVLLYEHEYLAKRGVEARSFGTTKKALAAVQNQICEKFAISPARIIVWDRSDVALTKIGSQVPVADYVHRGHGKLESRYEEAVRILRKNSAQSDDIMSLRSSLMSVLADRALYALRLYGFLTSTEKEKLSDIRAETLRCARSWELEVSA